MRSSLLLAFVVCVWGGGLLFINKKKKQKQFRTVLIYILTTVQKLQFEPIVLYWAFSGNKAYWQILHTTHLEIYWGLGTL